MVAVPESNAAIEDNRRRVNLGVKERKLQKKGSKTAPRLNRSAVFAVQVEAKLVEGIDKTLKFLKRTAARMPKGSKNRLNILERIHNLHLEQASYLRSQEERRYDRQWQAWDANGARGKEPQLNTRKSNSEWNAVIKSARIILKEFKRNKNADRILFNEAQALQYLGREKEAARKYTMLITNFPNSNVAGDAYSALGDYYYDRNDFNTASNNFKKAMKYKNSRLYLWSVFKLGWCSFNLGKYRDSLKYFQSVVSLSPRYKKQNLKELALRDMAFAFSELQMVDPAIRYYRANGGREFIGDLLKLLSSEFADQGKYKEAILVLKKFQTLEPLNQESPQMQKNLIELAYEMGNMKLVWSELKRFPGAYGPKSRWAAKHKGNKALRLETSKMIQDQFVYYSKITHKKAIETGSVGLHKEARTGYLLYMKTYPRASDSVEVLYNLSDIEFFLKNYSQSGRYSMIIVKRGKKGAAYKGANGKMINVHAKAAKEMVASYAKDFAPEFTKIEKLKPDWKKPKKITKKGANYLAACAEYKKHYPKDPPKAKKNDRVVESCEVDAAKIYYHLGNKPQSLKLLRAIALKYPYRPEGKASVVRLIPMYSGKGNEQTLVGLVDDFLKVPQYARDKELGPRLKNLKKTVQLDAIVKEKDKVKKAKKLEAFAKANPTRKDVATIYNNAAVAYREAGSIPDVIRINQIIIKRYPKFSETPNIIMETATIYLNLLDFAAASQYFEAFYKRYRQDKKAPVAYQKACELQLALESSKAVPTCIGFAKAYKSAGRPFVESLIDYAERKRNSRLMADLITRQYLNTYRLSANDVIVARYRLYKAAGKRGATATAQLRAIMQVYNSNRKAVEGEALEYVGEIEFRTADAVYAKYKRIKFTGGTFDRLDKSIKAKAAALQTYISSYDRVFRTKDPVWGVAALVRLGEGYEDFANMLKNPPGIKENPLEDVKKALAPQAAEMQQKAFENYKLAYETVAKVPVYTSWAKRAYDHFARVSNSSSRAVEVVPKPEFVISRVSPTVISEVKK